MTSVVVTQFLHNRMRNIRERCFPHQADLLHVLGDRCFLETVAVGNRLAEGGFAGRRRPFEVPGRRLVPVD